ncbi:hypothetical protein ABZ410_26740 [Streptomyces cinnamoneus]|uniref:hypothetical protein n=1 Tax=Streptomyces cinnamoneus TaxID=53446 RepID=UPI0033C79EF9
MRRASPYSTGGGGTVLEHRYGALLLSHLLTADPVDELGNDVTPDGVHFQASAYSPVDDLVLTGRSVDGARRQVSIGVRRDPSFVASDQTTVELIGSYLQVVHDHPEEVTEGRWRLALVVASPNTHVRQLKELAGIARDTASERRFRMEVSYPGRTNQGVRERLSHFDHMVASAAVGAGINMSGRPLTELTWRVLGALRLREVRLEGVDETDRAMAVGRLRSVVKAGTPDAADRLFSRLCELVGRYAPTAATKTADSLRRDLIGFPLAGHSSEDGDSDKRDDTEARHPAVLSDYLAQVRRIAPQQLLAREAELAQLANFCTDPDSEPYLWWRAQAWAGKSALLSTFVLDPPPGVRVLSFFITARLAGQADSTAFTEVVLEQTLELLGEPMPMMLTEATREAHLLGAFERAADLCRRRGERLVLVVDGLDEDRGVTPAADTHSIAAILPSIPPVGMRVIVSGRPNPPIPADVPDVHPLRWPSIVRPLIASPHAAVVRQDAERELKRLMHGSQIEKDLLGLLTAAGGGLSEADLAGLTGLSEWEIEDHLRAVSGRTFSSRAGRWRPQVAVYVLGHEDIQQQAVRFLGRTRLAEYRERIHAWAEGYRAGKWPVDTPEYLLRGYFKLLHVTGDIHRMLKCATDPDRHHRMLDIIGGDSVALGEILTAQESASSSPDPDLVTLSRLTVHRIKLTERNDHIPTHLPVVWAQLGRYSRAEALARSITTPAQQVRALTSIARHIATLGDLQRAQTVAEQAEQSMLAIATPELEAHAYAIIARTFACAGDTRRAQTLVIRAEKAARSLTTRTQREHALSAVARAAAAAEDVDHAVAVAKSLRLWSERAQALCAVATEVANSGDWRRARTIAQAIGPKSDRAHALAVVARAANANGAARPARDIARQAESFALSIRNPGRRAWILAAVAYEAASSGRTERAKNILRSAEKAAYTTTRASEREQALTAIARGLALSGDPDRAVALARGFDNHTRRAKALAVVASSLVSNGSADRAEEIAAEAEVTARSVSSRHHVGRDQAVLAQATASAGDLYQAEEIARAISDMAQRDRTLTVVAEAIAVQGDLDKADEVAAAITDALQRSKALLLVVRAGVVRDEGDKVRRIARSIDDQERRAKALALLSPKQTDVVGTDGDRAGVNEVPRGTRPVVPGDPGSSEANRTKPTTSPSSPSPYQQARDLISLACVAAEDGDVEQARSTVDAISSPALRVKGLLAVSIALTEAGRTQSAEELTERALAVVATLPNATSRDQTITVIAQQLASAGDPERAEQLAYSIASPPLRQRVLGTVASTTAKSGHLIRAERIARTISDASRRAKALAAIAQSAAGFGSLDEGERIAQSIADPIQRARALSSVAYACAGDGDLLRAENMATVIADPFERAKVLTALAVDFETDRSAGLLAQALSVGHWSICLPALVRLNPEIVTAVATEFLRANDQHDGTT